MKKQTKACDQYRKKNPDIKEQMATLLIQHNLLHGKDWEKFHQEIQKIVEKYYPLYQKGLQQWFKEDKINNNI
ncbi:MAG: hypothetical protein KJ597_06025 [Nanoarchaeota archaeon]|nr:hypothetical protein [Nanoarchaeota archaeon]MBU1623104.1 hypothetical protein [Nanoarchaeota archaeon]